MVERAGLDLERYDEPLLKELAQSLGVSADNFAAELDRAGIPAELLLVELLRLIAPYAEMMRDVLAFFTRAGAQSSSENIRIRFEFDSADDNFEFDLRNFRNWETRFREVAARLLVADIDDLRALELRHALLVEGVTYKIVGSTWIDVAPSDVEVAHWLTESRSGHGESARLPPPPRVHDAELQRLLVLVWQLLSSAAVADSGGVNAPVLALDDIRAIVRGAYLLRTNEALLLSRLRGVVGDVPLREVEANVLLEEIFEVFNLPVWKRRSELYSVWVGATLITAFDERARVHTVDGSLVFSFGGAHLATVPGTAPDADVYVWCELRSRASGVIGKGRKRAIQPDYVILGAPVTHPDSAILVVECKQYLRQGRETFAKALVDYANGHRRADVVLVNYGPASPAVLERVGQLDASVVGRTRVIAQLRPGSSDAIREFEDLVRSAGSRPTAGVDAVSPSDAHRCSTGETAGTSGTLRLSWEADVDLDLHCWVTDGHGARHHVYYSRPVFATGRSRLELDEDVRAGGAAETLTWTTDGDVLLDLAAHAYSVGADIARVGAEVEIQMDASKWIAQPPQDRSGEWWKLVSVERCGFPIRIWDSIGADVPFPPANADPSEV